MKVLSNFNTHAALFFAALAIGFSTNAAHAQFQTERAQFDAPFAFQYGSHLLPAGRYVVSRQYSRVLLVTDGSHSVMGSTRMEQDRKPITQGRIVFRKYGDRYFLGQVRLAGTSSYFDIGKSKPEKEAEKEVAMNSTAPATVDVALLEPKR